MIDIWNKSIKINDSGVSLTHSANVCMHPPKKIYNIIYSVCVCVLEKQRYKKLWISQIV